MFFIRLSHKFIHPTPMRLLYFLLASSIVSIVQSTTKGVANLLRPSAIVIDGNTLYISETSGGKRSKIDITDPNPSPTNVFTNLNQPYSFKKGMCFLKLESGITWEPIIQ